MAKKIEETAVINVEVKSDQSAQVVSQWEKLAKIIDNLPELLKKAGGGTKELEGQLSRIGDIFKNGAGGLASGSLNALAPEIKTLAGLLKGMKTITAGVKAVIPPDQVKALTDAANQAERLVAAMAKAGGTTQRNAAIQKGAFGLDTTTLKGADSALKTLQTRLTALKHEMSTLGLDMRMTKSPEVQLRKTIEKNIGALTGHRENLARGFDQIAFEAKQKKQWEADLKVQRAAAERAKTGVVLDTARDIHEESQTHHKTEKARQKWERQQKAQHVAYVKAQQEAQQKLEETAKTGKFLDWARDQQEISKQLHNLGDGRFVAKQNRTAFARGEGYGAEVAAGNRAETMLSLRAMGITPAQLGMSQEMAKLDQQRILNRDKIGELRRKGVADDNEELRLAYQLNAELKKRIQDQKALETVKAPKSQQQVREAESNRANSLLSRVRGEGGAALLGVQANLMFNYSMLSGVTGTIKSAISNSVQLEAAFRNVQAVTATTSTEMGKLEGQIKTVAASSRFSANEVAQAALVLGQAGLSSKEVGEALPAVLTLASAAGTSLAQAVDLATSVLGVFDKKATDTADIANKITQAANSSKVSVEKLALGLQYAGNIAAQSGITFEETTAAMATMSNAGIKSGSTMGTGLRQFLIELQKPSEEFLKTLSQLGLSISDIDLRAKGLTGVVQTLRSAGFVASDAIKSFDVRGAAAFNALLADPAALDRQHQGLLNTKAAVAANEIQMNSLQAQTTRLTTTFTNLASTGLDPIVKLLTIGAKGLASFTQWLAESEILAKGLMITLAGLGTTMVARHLGDMAKGAMGLYASFVKMRQEAAIAAAGIAATGVASEAAAVKVGFFGQALQKASMSTWIGVALTAAITAFELFGNGASRTAKAMDELKSKSNEAKAAFEEKDGAVKSLTKKIEDLEYKEGTLSKATQAELKPILLELKSEFSKYGLEVDTVNDKYSTMVQKLRDLKTSMQGLADSKLGSQLFAQERIYDESKKQSDKARDSLDGNVFTSKVATALNSFSSYGGMSPTQRKQFQADMAGLRNKSNTDEQTLNIAERLLQTARLSADGKGETRKKQVQEFEAAFREGFVTPLEKTVSAKFEVEGTKAQQAKRTADDAAAKARTFGGKTFEEAISRERDLGPLLAAEAARTGRKLNALEEAQFVRGWVADRFSKNEAMENTPGVTAGQKTEIHGVQERLRGLLSRAWDKNAQEMFKKQTEEMVANIHSGKGSKEEKAKRDRELRTSREIEFSKMGVVGTSAMAELNQRVATAKLAAANQKALDAAGGRTGKANASAVIDSLSQQATGFEYAANTKKRGTATASSVQEAEDMLDEGLGLLLQGKARAVEAFLKKSDLDTPKAGRTKETQAAIDAHLKSLEEQWDDKVENFVNAAPEAIKAVMKRLDKGGRAAKIQELQEGFKLLQNESEDAIYQAGEGARQLALEVAAGTRAGDGLSVRQAAIFEAKVKLSKLNAQLTALGDDTSGIIGELLQAFEDAKREREGFEGQLNTTMDDSKRAMLGVLIEGARGKEKSSLEALQGARKDRRGLQGEITSTSQFLAANPLPQEATIDSVMAKIRQASTLYQESLANIDISTQIGKGFSGVFEQATSSMSTFFTELVTRSKTGAQAIKGFAISIIKSMMDVFAQALAMQAVKGILNAFMGGYDMYGGTNGAANSALMSKFGNGIPAATGGLITGGTPGRDSVPIMAMPGEVIIPKTTVDAVGADYLLGLNARTSNTMAQGRASAPTPKTRQPDLTNVWIVAPEAKPTMGPKDIVMVITDDMMRGGMTKQLVRQIQTGAA